MAFTPSAPAQAIATLQGSNLANLAAAQASLQTAIAAGNLSPAAMIDAILSGVGYQAQFDTATTSTTTLGTFVNVFSAWTVSVPIVKTYLLHIDLSCYIMSVPDKITFQVLVDGATTGVSNPTNGSSITISQTGIHTPKSWRVPIAFATAGSHTIQLQFKSTGTGQANVDTGDFLTLTLTG